MRNDVILFAVSALRCTLFSTILLLPGIVAAQNQPDESIEQPKYMGNVRCVLCHDKELDKPISARRDLCLMNESNVFEEEDKHGLAYEQLFEPLGVQMLQQLGIRFDRDEKRFEDLEGQMPTQTGLNAQSCLSCHANWLKSDSVPATPPPLEVLQSGVTCESCHGPGSLYDQPHSEYGKWRRLSPKKKCEHGMIDVRNVVHRSERCFSCHIGNADEGKVVTHEMYAAGHPPLPGMEIETFAAQMPQHWRYLPEKSDFALKDKFMQANYPHEDKLPRSKAVLVGAIVAAREWLELFAAQSSTENGPEFGVYDCQACHHELRRSSWRQTRGYGKNIPGRPTALEWPSALLMASIIPAANNDPGTLGSNSDDLTSRLAELNSAVTSRPFGDSKTIQRLVHGADGLSARLTDMAEKVESSNLGNDDIEEVLAALYELPNKQTPDYHSARQIAWACRTLEFELRLEYPDWSKLSPRTLHELGVSDLNIDELNVLSEYKKQRGLLEGRVDEAFQPLDRQLRLMLPSGQKKSIEGTQPSWLRQISGYDPAMFREALQEVRVRLRAN